MATTPTYSWPIPDDTDLVKDGAEAIRDLGNAIDTTVDGLGVGLVHINTTTFSAVASQSINNVFTSTYQNYHLVFSGKCSTYTGVALRLRAAGTDNSTASSYKYQRIVASDASISGATSTATSLEFCEWQTDWNTTTVDIMRPQEAEVTTLFSLNHVYRGAILNYGGSHNQAVSYDGLTIFPGSGTMTGTVSIYGYKKV
jgi:hypothetical protein